MNSLRRRIVEALIALIFFMIIYPLNMYDIINIPKDIFLSVVIGFVIIFTTKIVEIVGYAGFPDR